MTTFPMFDANRKPYRHAVDGVIHLGTDRDVLADLGEIVPVDDRTDEFVTIPLRSVFDSGSGATFEFGVFSLGEMETVDLFNALVAHCRAFPSVFKLSPGGAA